MVIELSTAKLAKQLGFKEKTNRYYAPDKVYCYSSKANELSRYYPPTVFGDSCYQAPTQDELRTWLRRMFKVDIFLTQSITYHAVVYVGEESELITDFHERLNKGEDYEEALEEGLIEALEYLIKQL